MAVQTGEGTSEIIYGSSSIPAGPRTYGGYLARPDGSEEWPTVVVFGPGPSPSSSIKNICRVLARHGIAAIAPDLVGSQTDDKLVSKAIAAFITNPAGEWTNAEYGFGVLAFEGGLDPAADLVASDGRVLAFASVASTLHDRAVESLSEANIPGLFVGSRGDDETDIDWSLEAKETLPQTTFVVYPDGDSGFWNDLAPGFDVGRYDDVVARVVDFFADQLPPQV